MTDKEIERLKPGDCYICGQKGATSDTQGRCQGCYDDAIQTVREERQQIENAAFDEAFLGNESNDSFYDID